MSLKNSEDANFYVYFAIIKNRKNKTKQKTGKKTPSNNESDLAQNCRNVFAA